MRSEKSEALSAFFFLLTSHFCLLTPPISRRPCVQGLTNAVAYEVQAEQGEAQAYARPGDQPPADVDGVQGFGPVAGEIAPTGQWSLDAQAQEAEKTFTEDGGGDGQRAVDNDRAHEIGKNVPGDDAAAAEAQGAGGFDKRLFAQAHDLAAHDAGEGQPTDAADADQENQHVGPLRGPIAVEPARFVVGVGMDEEGGEAGDQRDAHQDYQQYIGEGEQIDGAA